MGRVRPIHAVAVSLVTATLLLATEPYLAIAWDEAYTLGREARVRAWFRALRDPVEFVANWRPWTDLEELVQLDGAAPPRPERIRTRWQLFFDSQVLDWFWPFAREEPHGHPPFYALLGLAGDLVAPASWPALTRARLGPILLFSLTAGVIVQFVASRWGPWPAALAAGSWVFQPNLFGHGHYASYDAVLAALWILAIVVFARAVEPTRTGAPGEARLRWLWTTVFGLILGCAAATKLTGWFLPLPFLVWVGLERDRAAARTLLLGLVIGSVTVLALMPPWWNDPIDGLVRFFQSNLTRGRTIVIPVLFLGKVYLTPNQSLPWYNTLVWTVMVTPLGFLIMGVLGIGSALRRWRLEPIGLLITGHWAFLMILRALPHTPGHDGVRQFLPAFGVLALLGGLGARALLERFGRWGRVAIVAALVEGSLSVAVMMPVPLSYFSPVVGGLPGAAALGMEPTYYWDALSPEARQWLAEHTPPGQTFEFASYPHSWLYLRRTGELPERIARVDRGPVRWYVLQNRPGAFSAADRKLVAEGRPAYTVSKLGVPLVWIFPHSELEGVERRHRD